MSEDSQHHLTAAEAVAEDKKQTSPAEQLARLHDQIYLAIAPDYRGPGQFGDLPVLPFDELPENVRHHRIMTAAKLIDQGWLSPEKVQRMTGEYQRAMALMIDTGKVIGMAPEDDFDELPAKVRDKLGLSSHLERLASERYVELLALRTRFQKELDLVDVLDDLPAEAPAPKPHATYAGILDLAAGELYDAVKGYVEAEQFEKAKTTNDAAAALLEIKQVLKNPGETIQLLARDRDLWQIRATQLEEKSALTEMALFQTQDAVIDLTKGHDKMIKLLERFARLQDEWRGSPVEGDNPKAILDNFEELDDDVTALLNSGEVRAIDL